MFIWKIHQFFIKDLNYKKEEWNNLGKRFFEKKRNYASYLHNIHKGNV